MRFWSLGFLAIAVLAALAGFSGGIEPVTFTRALFGIALVLFCVVLITRPRDQDQDGRSDH